MTGISVSTRVVALAIVASLATIAAPASAKSANHVPSGPAAQAIVRWFTTDRSLGCRDKQENDSVCSIGYNVGSDGEFHVYYGDSTGGGPQADAIVFVSYCSDPQAVGPYLPGGGNAPPGFDQVYVYFHRDGGNYRFIKSFPEVIGGISAEGMTVRFLPGKATISTVISRQPRLERGNYTVTLDPSPTGR
jgi:hypothetical protein